MPSRPSAAVQRPRPLASCSRGRFTGVSVHDGWKPYRAYLQCRHALCNMHHVRELPFLEEQYQQTWATELKALLREMKAAVAPARADALLQLPPPPRAAFVTRYQPHLPPLHAPNPPPPPHPSHP